MPVGVPISAGVTQGTLGGVRYNVVRDSGRHDLVQDFAAGNYQDNGCNGYINFAQVELDRIFGYKGEQAWLYKPLVAGQSLVTFNRARYITEVWVATTALGRSRLDYKPYNELRELYATVPLSSITTGTPAYWTKPVMQLPPEQYSETANTLTTAGLVDLDFLQYGNAYLLGGLIVMPPASSAMTLEALGFWRSKSLSADADVSVWTVNEQSLLEDMTRKIMEEKLHRNDEGAKMWRDTVSDRLRQLYYDLVSDEVSSRPTEESCMI